MPGSNTIGSRRTAAAVVILVLTVFLAAGAMAQMEPEDPISFQSTTVSPDWVVFDGFNASFDHFFIEDGQGIVHFFYNDYSMNVYHQALGADGTWLPPEPAAPVPLNSAGYHAAIAPDGVLCFVWLEDERFQNGDLLDLTQVLHVKRYRDGIWQEDKEVYDYRNPESVSGVVFAGFQTAFDGQGKLHTLYSTVGKYGYPQTRGMYLDGRMLMRYSDNGLTSDALVPGIGKMEAVRFFIDSRGVYHLIGMDTDARVPDSYPYAFTRCVHSFSKDGGKTWEGPFAVFDSGMAILQLAMAEDMAGALHMFAYQFATDQPKLVTAVLRPDDYKADDVQGYFNDAQIQQDMAGHDWEEVMRYLGLSFRSLMVDGTGTNHYFAGGMNNETLEFTLKDGNAWTVRVFEPPEDTADIHSILYMQNGDLFLEADQYGGMEPKMYFAKVPAQD